MPAESSTRAQRLLRAALVLRRDAVMRRVIDAVGTLPEYYRERTDFETVSRIIVGQQLSFAAATTIWRRVIALSPGWRASAVAAIPPAVLRGHGLSGSKARFILEAARRVNAGDLDFRRIRRLDDTAAAEALRGITGFGPWSVEMFLIFGMDRDDVFSVGDAGLRRAICSLYGLGKADYERKVHAISDRWRPYRSLACRWLWGWLAVDGA